MRAALRWRVSPDHLNLARAAIWVVQRVVRVSTSPVVAFTWCWLSINSYRRQYVVTLTLLSGFPTLSHNFGRSVLWFVRRVFLFSRVKLDDTSSTRWVVDMFVAYLCMQIASTFNPGGNFMLSNSFKKRCFSMRQNEVTSRLITTIKSN